MKEYDKNSLIGFILMAIILIVFNAFFFPEVSNDKTLDNIQNNTSESKDNTDKSNISIQSINMQKLVMN